MTEWTFEAVAENIPQLTELIDGQLEALDCSMKAQMQIDVAVDEIFGNIARYAYGDGRGDATVRFDFDGTSRMASISFLDRGMPFDPLKKADPDVTLSVEEREVGVRAQDPRHTHRPGEQRARGAHVVGHGMLEQGVNHTLNGQAAWGVR